MCVGVGVGVGWRSVGVGVDMKWRNVGVGVWGWMCVNVLHDLLVTSRPVMLRMHSSTCSRNLASGTQWPRSRGHSVWSAGVVCVHVCMVKGE